MAKPFFQVLRSHTSPLASAFHGYVTTIAQTASPYGVGESYETLERCLAVVEQEFVNLTATPGRFGVIQLMEAPSVRAEAFAVLSFWYGGREIWRSPDAVLRSWLDQSARVAAEGDMNYFPPEEVAA